MTENKTLVLLIEDNPVDSVLIRDILTENHKGFVLECFESLAGGLEYFEHHKAVVDIIILDLSLPDSQGFDTFHKIFRAAHGIPIVILTSLDDESLSIRAVQAGAQDYLVKGQVSGQLLVRSLKYAIQRKQVEQNLADALEFNQKILNSSTSGFLIYQSSGPCIFANAAAAAILKESENSLRTQNFQKLENWKKSGLYALSMSVIQSGESVQKEIFLPAGKNQGVWLDCHLTSFKNRGEEHLLLILNNITKRKTTESALEWEQYLLRSLLDSHPDSIFFKDSQGKYIRISKAGAQKMGYEEPDAIIGKTDYDLISNENARLTAEYEGMIMKTGMPMINLEMKETYADKLTAWSLATKIPLRDPQGNISGTFGISRDITERKQMEEALLDSQKRYKSLFDDSPTPMWEEDFSLVKAELDRMKKSGIRDFTGYLNQNPETVKRIIRKVKVLDVNKAVLKLHNAYRKEEIVNDLTCVFTEATYKNIVYELAMIAQGVRTFDFNQEMRTIDNKIRHVIIRWSSALGYEQSLKRVLISIIDITEHKLAEAALRESESMLNEAQKVAHIGSWTLDPETGSVKWSQELYRIYGVDPSQDAPDFDQHRTFFKNSEWEKLKRDLSALEHNDDIFETELNFRRTDGERRIMLAKGRLRIGDNGERLVVGTSQDITEMKRIDKELKIYREYLEEMIKVRTEELEDIRRQNELILNAVGDGIFGTDPEGRITFMNPAAAQMLNWKIEDALGQMSDIVIPITREDGTLYRTAENPICLTTRDGQTRRIIGELFRNKTGQNFPTEYLCSPLWENDRIIGAVVVFSNITEQKKAEEALQQAKEAAEKATKAKSEFLANMSHEIRTPMNAILGFADLLAVAVRDDKQRSQVDSIRNGAKNLLAIINDILDLSKIEAGKLKFENEPVNIRNLMTEVGNIFEQRIREKGLQFTTDIPGDFPGTILIDEIRLRQVLFNLIGNALKFTSQGLVRVSIRNLEKNKNYRNITLYISVQDSGIGIPPEERELIFEAFNQQIGQSSKKYGGTGLGLTITKRLVEMMGGRIQVESEAGKGSLFAITIPGLEYSEQSIERTEEKAFDPTSVVFMDAKVLICDDNPSDRKLLCDLLENYPIELLTTENGKQATQLVLSEHPDLILMDLKMPEMNGSEAARMLRNIPETQSIPIIAVSASVKINALNDEMRNLFDGYLLKPINLKELVDTLKNFLPYELNEKENRFESLLGEETVLTSEQQDRLPGLIEKLQKEYVSLHQEIMQTRKIDQMEAFGDRLTELGIQQGIGLLNEYGKSIKSMATNFDIEKLLALFNMFPRVIDKIRKLGGAHTWN